MKWFLRRFNYTRELEDAVREYKRELDLIDRATDLLMGIIDDYREMETTFTKLTLEEAHELFSACVDYQRALTMVVAPDPVQNRIIPIMEKYGITIERNTLADQVSSDELKEVVEYLNAEAGGPKPESHKFLSWKEVDANSE